nr:hypothetical protein [Actinomadura madurae]
MGRRGLVLSRMAGDRTLVLAACATALFATTVLAALVGYTGSVTREGLRRTLADATFASVGTTLGTQVPPNGLAEVRGQVDRALKQIYRDVPLAVSMSVRSDSYTLPGQEKSDHPELTAFGTYTGIERHARLAEGRWPGAGSGKGAGSGEIEAVLPVAAARAMHAEPDDVLTLHGRVDKKSVVKVRVVGLFEVPNPQDYFWQDDKLVTTGVEKLDYTTYGPFVVSPEVFADRFTGTGSEARFTVMPDLRGVAPGDLGPLGDRVAGRGRHLQGGRRRRAVQRRDGPARADRPAAHRPPGGTVHDAHPGAPARPAGGLRVAARRPAARRPPARRGRAAAHPRPRDAAARPARPRRGPADRAARRGARPAARPAAAAARRARAGRPRVRAAAGRRARRAAVDRLRADGPRLRRRPDDPDAARREPHVRRGAGRDRAAGARRPARLGRRPRAPARRGARDLAAHPVRGGRRGRRGRHVRHRPVHRVRPGAGAARPAGCCCSGWCRWSPAPPNGSPPGAAGWCPSSAPGRSAGASSGTRGRCCCSSWRWPSGCCR